MSGKKDKRHHANPPATSSGHPPQANPPAATAYAIPSIKGVSANGQQVVAFAQMHSGPLPPPEMLEHYEKVCPGLADRIMKMAEGQGDHRRELEKSVVKSNNLRAHIGQIIAGVVVVFAMFLGYRLLDEGKSLSGFATMLTPLAGVAGVFFYGKHHQSKDLKEKRQELGSK